MIFTETVRSCCCVDRSTANTDERKIAGRVETNTDRSRGNLVVKISDRGWHATSSTPVSLKTRRVGERYTLNLSRAQTSSRWFLIFPLALPLKIQTYENPLELGMDCTAGVPARRISLLFRPFIEQNMSELYLAERCKLFHSFLRRLDLIAGFSLARNTFHSFTS
ncbi:hypothetical protein TNCV_3034001 [Trichonephila clavipes]|nr:hypothetical protein TNCV_3034001 [Trichonephila clavipes]